jgi:hypothetical protein
MGTSLGETPASLAARIGDCPLEPRKLILLDYLSKWLELN